MTDPRIRGLAQILVQHSIRAKPGDRVLIESEPAAAPLVQEVYAEILRAGGHPQPYLGLPGLDVLHQKLASDEQLAFTPPLRLHAYENFEARILIHAASNTRELSEADPARLSQRRKATQPILEAQMRRGATKELAWVSTLFPTDSFAQDAEMSLEDYEDFVYQACHADDEDPVGYWRGVEKRQDAIVEALNGHDRIQVRSPSCELELSIAGRTFINAGGEHTMPDGEVFTGPVEDSMQGWIRFDFPAIWNGREAQGIELRFEDGKVVEASADKGEGFLLDVLETDPGARYVGEFAVGTNSGIQRFTRRILFDEKIGGTLHMALGAGYPDTGSQNRSAVHWDMICDMRSDSEIRVDGELVYQNGSFLI